MSVKIGVQAMMLKEKFDELGAFETLKKVSEIGYNSVEISQIPMTPENVAEIKRAKDELGMEIASLSAGLKPMMPGQEAITTHFDKIVEDCKTLDATILRIGMLPFDAMFSLEKVIEFCHEANTYALKFAEHGIKLYYHNHHIEFVKYDGKYLLDIIREEAPDIGFELDVHWIQRAGLNPSAVIKEYAGKVDLIHLKDYRMVPVSDKAMDALFKQDIALFMNYFQKTIEFAELGEGNLDLKDIIETSIASGAKYLLVEQDEQYGRDPFDCLITSRNHLIALGYQDLF